MRSEAGSQEKKQHSLRCLQNSRNQDLIPKPVHFSETFFAIWAKVVVTRKIHILGLAQGYFYYPLCRVRSTQRTCDQATATFTDIFDRKPSTIVIQDWLSKYFLPKTYTRIQFHDLRDQIIKNTNRDMS